MRKIQMKNSNEEFVFSPNAGKHRPEKFQIFMYYVLFLNFR